MIPPFSVVAPMASADGYGHSAECMVLAAHDLGADVQFVAHDWQDRRFTDPRLMELEVDESAVADRELVVVHFLPFAFSRFRSRVTIGSTMFETNQVPPFWVPLCNSTDGLLVPSEFCRRSFQRAVDVPVEVAPLGVDTDFYKPVRRERSHYFKFLMAGLLHYRKGAEFAVRAFKEEFHPNEPVRLILKTRRGFLDLGDETLDERITVIDEDYSRVQLRALYHQADCFIACSRGEASGLTPREAMATGLPAIVTNWSGLTEVADERYTYPTGIDFIEKAPPDCSSYDQDVAGRQPIGEFCRPSVADLRVAMREVYGAGPRAQDRGLAAAAWMREEWDWSVCAEKWLGAIGRLYDRATAVYTA